MTAQEFKIAFTKAMLTWYEGAEVGTDPRGEWEYQQAATGRWFDVTNIPGMPAWDMPAYRWKPAKKRMTRIPFADGTSVELVAPEVDALRLAVKLNITVSNSAAQKHSCASVLNFPGICLNKHKDDPYAATLVRISEYGEGQENDCLVCGAEPGSPCTGEDPAYPDSELGVEYGNLVHLARQAKVTQGEMR